MTFASLLHIHPSSCPVEGVIKSRYMVTRIKYFETFPSSYVYMYCDDSIFLFHDFKVHVQIHQISLND